MKKDDEAAILALGEKIQQTFAVNLAAQAVISASTFQRKRLPGRYFIGWGL